MKTLLTVVLGIIAINSFSQELPNKFTNPRIKDTSISVNLIPSVSIDGSGLLSSKNFLAPSLNTTFLINNSNSIDTNIRVYYSKETQLPTFIESNQIRQTIKSQSVDTIKKVKSTSEINSLSFNYLNEIQSITNMSLGRSDLEIIDTKVDENGKSHIKYQQKLNGIKIYGNQFYVHLDKNGQGEYFNGNYNIINRNIELVPTISKDSAFKIVEDELKKKVKFQKLTDFQINILGGTNKYIDTFLFKPDLQNDFVLVYKITFFPNSKDRYEVFVDAHNGIIIKMSNASCSIETPKVTQNIDLNGINRQINSTYNGQIYTLKDITKPMYNSTTGNGFIIIGDQGNTIGDKYLINDVTSLNNTWTPTQSSSMFNAGSTYDFYKNVHNRNSIDGNGGNIYSVINVPDDDGSSLGNAYWNGAWMSYGNGDASFKPLAGALDVSGHEMTHGVISKTAGLLHDGQPGTIDESMADIFGAMLDSTNWTIGESVVKSSAFPSGAMRSISNPHNGGTNINDLGIGWQPRHMSEFVSGSILDKYKDRDNEGRHINSGIPSYAFYLLSNSIGRLKASRIYYKAITSHLVPNSDFTALRIAIVKSASELYSNTEAIQAGYAFDAVGINDGVTQIIEKKLLPNPGQETMLLYGSNISDTTIYLGNATIKSLWQKKINNKPSITDDGKTAYLVGGDNKIYSITVDPSLSQATYSLIQSQPMWSSVAISKDGKRLAAVTNAQDTAIYVYDFGKKNWFKFKLFNPTNTLGKTTAGPIYADSFEWDYSSENIIYDCYNKTSNTTGSGEIKYWDINLINVWNKNKDTSSKGSITKLFRLSDGQNVGNPSFSKNSPDIFAFDYFNDSTKTYAIYGYNIQTNKISTTPIVISNTLGFPSYNKNDDKIAFNKIVSSRLTISSVTLNPDKISSTGTSSVIYNNATYPLYYTTGNRKFSVPSTPIISINRSTNLCTGDSITLTSNAFSGNQWFKDGVVISNANKQTYTTNTTGNYSVLSNVDSISSSLSLALYVTMNPIPPTPIIGRDTSGYLNSTNQYGNIWYKDGVIITDTTKKIKPAINGLYTAKTVLNGCSSSMSNSYYFLVTDIVNLSSTEYIKINPNPFYNNLNFEFKVNGHQQLNIDVFSLSTGQKITTKYNQYSGSSLNFSQMSSGVYIFIVYSADNKIRTQFKIVKL